MLKYVKGDTKPDFTFFLERDRAPIPELDTAQRIDFKLTKPSGTVVTRQLTIVDVATAQVQGAWSVGDLSEGGEQWGDVVITWADGVFEHPLDPVLVHVREEGSPE